jgi:hypothetical protein
MATMAPQTVRDSGHDEVGGVAKGLFTRAMDAASYAQDRFRSGEK